MKRVEVKNKAGETLVGDLLYNEAFGKSLILTLNGYVTHRNGGMKRLTDILFSKKHNCLRFDYSGTGESEGDHAVKTITDWIDDALCIIEYARGLGFEKIALIGGSLGATVAICCALAVKVDTLYLTSPSTNYVDQQKSRRAPEYFEEWKKRGFIKRVNPNGTYISNYSFWEDAQKYVFDESVRKITCPVILVHGDKDESVPIEHSYAFLKLLPSARLEVIKGGNHKLSVDGDFSDSLKVLFGFFEGW